MVEAVNRRDCPACAERYPLHDGRHDLPDGGLIDCRNRWAKPVDVQRENLTENQVQRAVFQHIAQRGAPGLFAFHPANGGFRRPVEAKILKGLGVKSGVPDIIAIHQGRVFCLELKTWNGVLSDAQEHALPLLAEAGAVVGVGYGLAHALRWLEERGLLRGEIV